MLDHRASICYWMLESSLHVDWRQPLAFSRSRWPSIYYRIETSSKDDLTHAFHHPLRIPYAYTRVLALAREYGWTVEYLDSRLVSRSSHGVPQITALFFTYVHRIDEFHAVRSHEILPHIHWQSLILHIPYYSPEPVRVSRGGPLIIGQPFPPERLCVAQKKRHHAFLLSGNRYHR